MHRLRNLFQGLRSLFDRRRTDREIDEELDGFLEASREQKLRAGVSPC
jgi:hypothetical protein